MPSHIIETKKKPLEPCHTGMILPNDSQEKKALMAFFSWELWIISDGTGSSLCHDYIQEWRQRASLPNTTSKLYDISPFNRTQEKILV